jgi:BirA family biotin operon repressor/biotin-[acetyl-CoA-carboxylase] ligase
MIPSPLRRSAVLAAARGRRFLVDFRVLGVVDSTLDVVADLARRGAPDGLVVVAESQRRGRGRRGGVWASSAGEGLYLTALVRPAPTGAAAQLLAGAAGLAAAAAVRRTTALEAQVKWPNDVWVAGRKVGGVLIETASGEDGYAAIGVGLTLVAPRAGDVPAGVAPLGGLSDFVTPPPAREALAAALLDALEERLDAAASAPETLRAEYRAHDALRGLTVVLELPEGPVVGVVRDADLLDGLELERPDGSRFRVRAALAHVAAVVRREAPGAG